MEFRRIILCAGPGTTTFTKEEEAEMMEAFAKAFEEYEMQLFSEATLLDSFAKCITYTTLQPDKETLIELTQRLKRTKNPMEIIQIQRQIGVLSKSNRKVGKANGT